MTKFQLKIFLKAAYEKNEGANDLCLSFCSSKERYKETIELGAAFTRSVNSSYKMKLEHGLAYPVAVGLAARKYKDNIPEEIKQRRLSEIINLQLKHSFENLSTYIDKYSNVLIEKESKKSKE